MSRKSHLFIPKLWKNTSFHIYSESGRNQIDLVHETLQNFINAFNTFAKAILTNLNEIKNAKINIPALSKIRQQLLLSKPRFQTFIQQQQTNLNTIFNTVTELRYILQNSEFNATRQYNQKMKFFINSKDERVSVRKIERTHLDFIGLDYSQKVAIKNHQSSPLFQRWLADFYLRSEDFFLKAYSDKWHENYKDQSFPFKKMRNQQSFSDICFEKKIEKEIKQMEIGINEQKKQKLEVICNSFPIAPEMGVQMKENRRNKELDQFNLQNYQENDIVSQIFKELEKFNPN